MQSAVLGGAPKRGWPSLCLPEGEMGALFPCRLPRPSYARHCPLQRRGLCPTVPLAPFCSGPPGSMAPSSPTGPLRPLGPPVRIHPTLLGSSPRRVCIPGSPPSSPGSGRLPGHSPLPNIVPWSQSCYPVLPWFCPCLCLLWLPPVFPSLSLRVFYLSDQICPSGFPRYRVFSLSLFLLLLGPH